MSFVHVWVTLFKKYQFNKVLGYVGAFLIKPMALTKILALIVSGSTMYTVPCLTGLLGTVFF